MAVAQRTARRRRPGTATKFRARPNQRRTTVVKHEGGAIQPTYANEGSAVWRLGALITGTGSHEIARIGGLKLTFRSMGATANYGNMLCAGILKASGDESLASGQALTTAQVRRVFAKETWMDVGSHAPTLVQHAVKGMLSLAGEERLYLVTLAINLLGSTGPLLLNMAEWSERRTDTDA